MNPDFVQYFQCPDCGNNNMAVESFLDREGHIFEGRLICGDCGRWFRIQEGIADLLPKHLREESRYEIFTKKYQIPFQPGLSNTGDCLEREQMSFFNRENALDYENRVVNSHYYQALNELTFIHWLKKLTPGDLVLELGCGTGKESLLIAQAGMRVVGLDISEDMLRLAALKIGGAGIINTSAFLVADAMRPPVNDSSFKACLFYGSLHHLSDPERAVSSSARKLISDGLFYSLDPHNSPVRFLFDWLMRLWKLYEEKAGEDPLFSEKQVAGWLQGAGIQGTTQLSTFFPPHLFHLLGKKTSVSFLKYSDFFFSKVPWLKKMAGVIVAEGIKRTS
jgi:ubiquinone/menaquinone biosynthesis C-methylase UbiE/uncharacterized protein YbaR (Trm112 family)